VGPRTGLDAVIKIKNSSPAGRPDRSLVSVNKETSEILNL